MRIGSADCERLFAHARRTYPRECCGLIIGPPGEPLEVDKIQPSRNVRQDHPELQADYFGKDDRQGYFIDPLEFIKISKDVREEGLLIRGVYHSHPDGPAVLSSADHHAAVTHDGKPLWPGWVYVVMGIANDKSPELRAFRWSLKSGQWLDIKVIITDR